MKILRTTLIACTTVVFTTAVNAQDIHFSQSFNAHQTFQPANTGAIDADWRLNHNYRQQWSSLGRPFRTIGIGYDQPIYQGLRKMGIGVQFYHDQSGPVGLQLSRLQLGWAYHLKLGKHQLSFGVQANGNQRSFNLGQATLPDQYNIDNGGFGGINTNDPLAGQSVFFFSTNAGLRQTFNWEKLTLDLDLAAFHLNRPKDSFFKDYQLPIRWLGGFAASYKLTENLNLLGNFQQMSTAKAQEALAALRLRFKLSDAAAVEAGGIFRDGLNRNPDAVSPYVGLRYSRWHFGLNYDINISDLSLATGGRGAFEFAITLLGPTTLQSKTKRNCERY